MFEDIAIWQITWRSIYVSLIGTVLAMLLAYPLSYLLSSGKSWWRAAFLALMQAFMAMPPVIVGLGLYLLFRPQALFGDLGWLYSIEIMILAQFLIVFPILFSLGHSEFERVHIQFQPLFCAFPRRMGLEMRAKIGELRFALLTILLVGFGRAVGEVGAVMIVGGNLAGRTEVMSTVIVEETGKGNLDRAISVGLVLILIALFITMLGLFWRKKAGDDIG